MEFPQAEKEFKQLKAQFETGKLTETEFKSQLEKLMVQDDQGHWWMIGYETERWYRHDGTNWVQTDPPGSTSRKPTPVVTPEPETRESKSIEKANREDDEKLAREKAEQVTAEKAAQEKAEREATDKTAHEQVVQKPERNVETIAPLEDPKDKIVEEKIKGDANQNIFLEVKQRIFEKSTWRFGKREILPTVVGIILLNILGLFFVRNSSPFATLFYGGPPFGTYFDPRNAILLFFSLLFGPVVGFIVGFLGGSIGSFPLPGLTDISYFSSYARYARVWIPLLIWLLRGFMGVIMGLAKLPLPDLISNRNFLRTGLFVLFAFIPSIFISIFGAGFRPDDPVRIMIAQWLRFPNRFENIIIELVFTFIYLSIFIYIYLRISKFMPGIVPTDYSETEQSARENDGHRVNENTAGSTVPKTRKSDMAINRLFQTWWGRGLLGGILGLILGFIYVWDSGYFDEIGIVLVIFGGFCSLAGLITYPHKLSIVLLILGFLVAGVLAAPEFYVGAGLFGIPAGALLSRILYWTKVLK